VLGALGCKVLLFLFGIILRRSVAGLSILHNCRKFRRSDTTVEYVKKAKRDLWLRWDFHVLGGCSRDHDHCELD